MIWIYFINIFLYNSSTKSFFYHFFFFHDVDKFYVRMNISWYFKYFHIRKSKIVYINTFFCKKIRNGVSYNRITNWLIRIRCTKEKFLFTHNFYSNKVLFYIEK